MRLPATRPTLPASLSEFRELEADMVALREQLPKSEEKFFEFLRFWSEHDYYFFMMHVFSTRDWYHDTQLDTADITVDLAKNPDQRRKYLRDPFIFEACRRIQTKEHDVLRIWSREHLKTTLVTIGRNVHRLVENLPASAELTIGIASDIKGLSKTFLAPIKDECEKNKLLYALWPELFYLNPRKESPRWSMSDDPNPKLQLKRQSLTTKEATFEAIGLEALPTGPHYSVLNYDDIVTARSVRSTTMMEETRQNYRASLSLGREGGIRTYVGTFYHPLDAYHDMIRDGNVEVEVIPCWHDKPDKSGKVSVFYSVDYLTEKKKLLGDEEFAIQWECNPHAGQSNRFDEEWLRYYTVDPETFHSHSTGYILVDSASSTKEYSVDFTVIQFWDVGIDGKMRLVDMIRDRLNPVERVDAIIEMWDRWATDKFIEARVESYGMDETLFFLELEQQKRGKQFPAISVAGAGHGRSKGVKKDRIQERLIPAFRNGEILLPETLIKPCKYKGGAMLDLVDVFRREEYLVWPLVQHDDIFDTMSRLYEPTMPVIKPGSEWGRRHQAKNDRYARALQEAERKRLSGNWMAPGLR